MSNSVVEGTLGDVRLDSISANKISLRPPKTDDPQFQDLLNSVRSRGVLKPILVSDNGNGTYTLIDGLQRFTAAQMVNKEQPTRNTIKANIVQVDSDTELELQIILNNNTVKTRPVEYAKGILRILQANPDMRQSELAEKLSISIPTMQNYLRLSKLREPIQELVNQGKMRVTNAYQLAKLPDDEQEVYLDDSMIDDPNTFISKVEARLKQIKEAKANQPEPVGPPIKIRRMPEVRDRYTALINSNPSGNDLVVANTLAWVLSQDPESVSAWKVEQEERDKKKAETELLKANKKREEAEKEAEKARAALASH